MKFNTIIENQSLEMEFSDSLNQFSIKTENDVGIDCVKLSHNSYSLILNGQSHYLTINPHLQGYEVTVDHHTHLVHVQDEVDICAYSIFRFNQGRIGALSCSRNLLDHYVLLSDAFQCSLGHLELNLGDFGPNQL